MQEPFVIHSTFVIERSYPVTPEKLFSAFADPAKKQSWYGDRNPRNVEVFEMDFREGGTEHFRYRMGPDTPFPGTAIENEGVYHQIVPNKCIVTSSAMKLGGKHISTALLTIELLPTDRGTDMLCTHQGAFFEGSGGPKMREEGWNTLFDRLAKELAS